MLIFLQLLYFPGEVLLLLIHSGLLLSPESNFGFKFIVLTIRLAGVEYIWFLFISKTGICSLTFNLRMSLPVGTFLAG